MWRVEAGQEVDTHKSVYMVVRYDSSNREQQRMGYFGHSESADKVAGVLNKAGVVRGTVIANYFGLMMYRAKGASR